MNVIFLTLFISLLLALLFVFFFVYSQTHQKHKGAEQQALLPFEDESSVPAARSSGKASSVPKIP